MDIQHRQEAPNADMFRCIVDRNELLELTGHRFTYEGDLRSTFDAARLEWIQQHAPATCSFSENAVP